jgi:phosphatidylserine decarboxylase
MICMYVCMYTVGATMVGSINYVVDVNAEAERHKGDVHGYFSFGGSTVILFFEPNTIAFDKDLLDNSARHMETLVKVTIAHTISF